MAQCIPLHRGPPPPHGPISSVQFPGCWGALRTDTNPSWETRRTPRRATCLLGGRCSRPLPPTFSPMVSGCLHRGPRSDGHMAPDRSRRTGEGLVDVQFYSIPRGADGLVVDVGPLLRISRPLLLPLSVSPHPLVPLVLLGRGERDFRPRWLKLVGSGSRHCPFHQCSLAPRRLTERLRLCWRLS